MKKPNLIYIFADDMGYGDVSCNNDHAAFQTPAFDALAKDGMRFTDAHSSSAVCTPSRYSVVTGRYNWRSCLKHGVNMGESASIIESGRKTIAHMLKEDGYNTACVGKWHLGWDWSFTNKENNEIDFTKPIQHGPLEEGFDSYFGIAASLDMSPYVYIDGNMPTAVPDHITANRNPYTWWREGPTAPDFVHEQVLPTFTHKVLDKIDEFSESDKPFFIYFPLNAPHTPILPTKDFLGKSGTNVYGDFVLMCDDVVRQICDKLKEKGLEEDTIVIFTSDNGCSPEANYEELAKYGHNPSYIFRGTKSDIYEGGHRIPLLIRWPAIIPAGKVCDQTVCLCDIMRTMADINGITLPDNAAEDSVSNLPLWLGKNEPVREAIVHHSIDGRFAITKGEWKLIMWPGSGGWSYPTNKELTDEMPPIQLYHMKGDVSETCNVQGEHEEIVKELKELLIRYIKDGRSTPGAPQENFGGCDWPQLSFLKE